MGETQITKKILISLAIIASRDGIPVAKGLVCFLLFTCNKIWVSYDRLIYSLLLQIYSLYYKL